MAGGRATPHLAAAVHAAEDVAGSAAVVRLGLLLIVCDFLGGSLLKSFVIGFLLDRLVLQTTHRAFRNDRAVFLAVTGDVFGPTRVVGERINVRRTSRERHCLRKMKQALRPYRS